MIFRQLLRLAPWLLSAFILCAAIWHTNANAETSVAESELGVDMILDACWAWDNRNKHDNG